ncbi:hypothetical protein [Blastochloris tepida]|uniref:Uncharacterized protein n=1 Tax=Blastochloris tepida TaxID=2233851 RepID=A0A348G1X0_9HYPH|nr:hypothetical protein [Blastochloris tepida]BBF93553.1 hypothetical protein BLTE_22380 [Blastochloris tepida]
MAAPSNGTPQEIEKLRRYLNGLSPEACAKVAAELEREARAGGRAGLDVVLQELHAGLRGRFPAEQERRELANAPQRLFFQPLGPFLIDETPAAKVRGRIPRASLAAVWTWIARDLVPVDAKTYSEAVTALMPDDEAAAAKLAKSFQDHVLARMRAVLDQAGRDEVAARRLAAQFRSQREVEELRDIVAVLRARDALTAIASRLPPIIRNLADETMTGVRAVFNAPLTRHPEVFPYALVVLMGRLVQPWQILRFAARMAETDSAAKIAEMPAAAAAVELAFAELERRAPDLGPALRRRDMGTFAQTLKDVHDFVRGFRTELDLAAGSPWAKRLAAVRKDVASLLSDEIAAASAEVRRLLKPRNRREAAAEPLIPAPDVAAAEDGVELVLLCRNYASEIALNEATQRAMSELNALLDAGTSALIDSLRAAGDAERAFRRSQLDLAVALARRVLGDTFAQLLAKSVELAAQGRPAENGRPAEPAPASGAVMERRRVARS